MQSWFSLDFWVNLYRLVANLLLYLPVVKSEKNIGVLLLMRPGWLVLQYVRRLSCLTLIIARTICTNPHPIHVSWWGWWVFDALPGPHVNPVRHARGTSFGAVLSQCSHVAACFSTVALNVQQRKQRCPSDASMPCPARLVKMCLGVQLEISFSVKTAVKFQQNVAYNKLYTRVKLCQK